MLEENSGTYAASAVSGKRKPQQVARYNGVAERALHLILVASLAARIQAPVLYPLAPTDSTLWAESVSWACSALYRNATIANPRDKSAYELRYGYPPRGRRIHFSSRPPTK